jgi:hypothetical protein
VVLPRHVDAGQLLGGRLRHAVEGDGVGGGQLPAIDALGLLEELPGLGPPGLLAFLAPVWEQVVIPRNAVHGGGERISVQPALMETVGQVAC